MQSDKSDHVAQEEAEHRLTPDDVRLVFKELRLIQPSQNKRGSLSTRNSPNAKLT